MDGSFERVSDDTVDFHLGFDRKRWAVWTKVRGNRTIVMVVTHGVTINNGRRYNTLGTCDTLHLTNIPLGAEISEWKSDG